MRSVIDASVTLGWAFEDEHTPTAFAFLERIADGHALVPAIWPFEVANALIIAERRKRISTKGTARFLELLQSLPIEIDVVPTSEMFHGLIAIARRHHLSAYDAAHLELALRERIPLATLDDALNAAAKKAGVSRLLHE